MFVVNVFHKPHSAIVFKFETVLGFESRIINLNPTDETYLKYLYSN